MKLSLPLRRALLTNDDGFDAPGLAVLAEVASAIADEIWIVAPHQDQSGTGQCISLNSPLRCQPKGERQWSVDGTPADCAILGISHFMKDNPPSILLSGVNGGNNTGDCVNLSGTLGAAFSGLMMGIPSIAISIDRPSRDTEKWDTARAVLPDALTQLIHEGWRDDCCLSINIPDAPAEQISGICRAVPRKKTVTSFITEERTDLRDKKYFWIFPKYTTGLKNENDDVSALHRKQIAVSELALERQDGGA